MARKHIKAPETIAALKELYRKHGGILKPQMVVDAARPTSHPLHKYFEWDNSKAANDYRVWQARHLLEITVEIIKTPGGDVPFNVFCSLTTDRNDAGGYRTTVDVMSNVQFRKQLIADAMRDMEIFEKRYRDIVELAEIFKAIKITQKKLR